MGQKGAWAHGTLLWCTRYASPACRPLYHAGSGPLITKRGPEPEGVFRDFDDQERATSRCLRACCRRAATVGASRASSPLWTPRETASSNTRKSRQGVDIPVMLLTDAYSRRSSGDADPLMHHRHGVVE